MNAILSQCTWKFRWLEMELVPAHTGSRSPLYSNVEVEEMRRAKVRRVDGWMFATQEANELADVLYKQQLLRASEGGREGREFEEVGAADQVVAYVAHIAAEQRLQWHGNSCCGRTRRRRKRRNDDDADDYSRSSDEGRHRASIFLPPTIIGPKGPQIASRSICVSLSLACGSAELNPKSKAARPRTTGSSSQKSRGVGGGGRGVP